MDCGWLWSCKFIGCNKCTTLVRNIDNGGAIHELGQDIYETSLYHISNFCCELKTALKNKVDLIQAKIPH